MTLCDGSSLSHASRAAVPCREMIPSWDGEWWESDAELAALAQREAELDHDAVWSWRYDPDFDRDFDDERSLFP